LIKDLTESGISLNNTVENINLPKFEDIPVPTVIALLTGSGVGSKPLQSLLDGHEQIYMIPAYPLLYFYPHWSTWEKSLKDWSWNSIIDIFCEKHASVIDSRRIPGHNGLTTLGIDKNEHIEIDENLFKKCLLHFLTGQKIGSKLFILAIHYAYSICKQEYHGNKHLLIYHIHEVEYLGCLVNDFPDVKVVGMSRDPRANIEGRVRAAINVDQSKLNSTDSKIYEKHIYRHVCIYIFNDTHRISEHVDKSNVCIVKLEELYYKQDTVMKNLCYWLGIQFTKSTRTMTFDGKLWWGDKVYNMDTTNGINSRVVSQNWKNTLGKKDWFVIEGIQFDLLKKYNYQLYTYKTDSILNKILLVFAILYPSRFELDVIRKYFNPKEHVKFIKLAWLEARGDLELKDYTWNATHLYKTTYSDFKLWQAIWNVRLMLLFREQYEKNPSKNTYRIANYFGMYIYLLTSYLRYLWSFLLSPLTITLRWKVMFYVLWRRLNSNVVLPDEIVGD
jgi:hypothetical protein